MFLKRPLRSKEIEPSRDELVEMSPVRGATRVLCPASGESDEVLEIEESAVS